MALDVEPVLKYPGGKRWLAEQLASSVHDYLYGRPESQYVEPFFGAGAVGLNVAHWGHACVFADALMPLMEVYDALRSNCSALLGKLGAMIERGTDEESYYRVREDRPFSLIGRAAQFVYLNRLGYNGMVRYNKKGLPNVPWGKNPNASVPDPDAFELVSRTLQGATLLACDFSYVIELARAGDVVYADPPYHGGFVGYTPNDFSEADQVRLAKQLQAAFDRGVTVIMTNADTDLIRGLYGDWMELVLIDERRNVSCSSSRPKAPCLIGQAGAL